MNQSPARGSGLTGRERCRWEWRWSPAAPAPYADLERFLGDEGVDVADLSRTPRGAASDRTLGAAILLGGGWPLLGHGAAESPAAAVPDVVAVVFEPGHSDAPKRERASVVDWSPSWTDAEHAAAVEVVRAAIARGDLYQANVVGHRSGRVVGDPTGIGAALGDVPDAPYAGSVTGDGWSVHCASPELLLDVAGGVATTRPIKGTAVRGADEASDAVARERLRRSAKDRAEHVMIVDLERNDLARVARTGGVEVHGLYDVRPLAGLWHAESTVTASLRPGVGLAELLDATFPGGSVTGAPKRAALQQIAALEPVGRGPSMGALGWVSAAGELTLGLTIRTVAVAGDRAHLWTGGGVTWSSVAQEEVAEAAAKAAPLLAALRG